MDYLLNYDGKKRVQRFLTDVEKFADTLFGKSKTQGPQEKSGYFIGVITYTGKAIPDTDPVEYEADFSNEVYWVKAARITNDNPAATEAIVIEAFADDDPNYLIIPATNYAETLNPNHSVAEGTPVIVRTIRSRDNADVVRYFFKSLPADSFFYIGGPFVAAASYTANGNAFSAPPAYDRWVSYNNEMVFNRHTIRQYAVWDGAQSQTLNHAFRF